MFEVIGYPRKWDKSVQYNVLFDDCDDPIFYTYLIDVSQFFLCQFPLNGNGQTHKRAQAHYPWNNSHSSDSYIIHNV
jgi:hypothetical protein